VHLAGGILICLCIASAHLFGGICACVCLPGGGGGCRVKEEVAEGLAMVDFEQLKIENR